MKQIEGASMSANGITYTFAHFAEKVCELNAANERIAALEVQVQTLREELQDCLSEFDETWPRKAKRIRAVLDATDKEKP